MHRWQQSCGQQALGSNESLGQGRCSRERTNLHKGLKWEGAWNGWKGLWREHWEGGREVQVQAGGLAGLHLIGLGWSMQGLVGICPGQQDVDMNWGPTSSWCTFMKRSVCMWRENWHQQEIGIKNQEAYLGERGWGLKRDWHWESWVCLAERGRVGRVQQ